MQYPYYFGIPDEELEANKRADKPRKLVLMPDHRFFYLGHGFCDDSGPCMQVVREICDIYRNINLQTGVAYLTNKTAPHPGQITFEGFTLDSSPEYYKRKFAPYDPSHRYK